MFDTRNARDLAESGRRTLYRADVTCGFGEARTVQMIAGVGLCRNHLQRVRDIADGKDDRPRPKKRITHRVVRARCRCGQSFVYRQKQGGKRTWCNDCSKLDMYQRRKRVGAVA